MRALLAAVRCGKGALVAPDGTVSARLRDWRDGTLIVDIAG
jgi:hypothetical protein